MHVPDALSGSRSRRDAGGFPHRVSQRLRARACARDRRDAARSRRRRSGVGTAATTLAKLRRLARDRHRRFAREMRALPRARRRREPSITTRRITSRRARGANVILDHIGERVLAYADLECLAVGAAASSARWAAWRVRCSARRSNAADQRIDFARQAPRTMDAVAPASAMTRQRPTVTTRIAEAEGVTRDRFFRDALRVGCFANAGVPPPTPRTSSSASTSARCRADSRCDRGASDRRRGALSPCRPGSGRR